MVEDDSVMTVDGKDLVVRMKIAARQLEICLEFFPDSPELEEAKRKLKECVFWAGQSAPRVAEFIGLDSEIDLSRRI